jgi:hypothetical protein
LRLTPLLAFVRGQSYAANMLEQIRTYLRHTPFRPFQIRCSNGDVFPVEHPENAAIVKHTVVVALPNSDQAIMLSALHIVGVSGLEQMAA